MIPLAQKILALPNEDVSLEDADPHLGYCLMHNLAAKIIGSRIAGKLEYLPMPEEVPPLSETLRWASAESIRLEALGIEEVRHEREGAPA